MRIRVGRGGREGGGQKCKSVKVYTWPQKRSLPLQSRGMDHERGNQATERKTRPRGEALCAWAVQRWVQWSAMCSRNVVHNCLKDIIDLLEDDDGRAHILSVVRSEACRIAAAQASAHDSAPVVQANVTLCVAVSAPPPPPINVMLQVVVPRATTADVGSRNRQVQNTHGAGSDSVQLVWHHNGSADRCDGSQHGGSRYDDGGHCFFRQCGH